ncbi:hypothetical protein H4W33_003495 [Kibdelosporangium phytohabitans]|nr:hypothetical protein [Kibdelosporangium phytohabitans]
MREISDMLAGCQIPRTKIENIHPGPQATRVTLTESMADR